MPEIFRVQRRFVSLGMLMRYLNIKMEEYYNRWATVDDCLIYSKIK
jgi:hypothetical protein